MIFLQYIKTKPALMNVLYSIQDFFRKRLVQRKFEDLSEYWQSRIRKVCDAPINKSIERCTNAGSIVSDYQIMHNGIKIYVGSYYGYGESFDATHIMLKMNRGVHEPEEEYHFGKVLHEMKPGAVMIELGAYWSYYSMWFNKEVKNAHNFMIEPDARSLYSGKRNFSLNGFKGHFFQYYIGAKTNTETIPTTISLDDFLSKNLIKHVDILHCDIQGFEFEMLQGAVNTLNLSSVNYIFISTHSDELHHKCICLLKEKKYDIVAEINLENISSFDGLIVAKSKAAL